MRINHGARFGLTLISLCLLTRTTFATVTSVGLDKTAYTSDFMIGSVVVAVIFPESDGTVDPNIENWSDERKSQVMSQIMSGHEWWTQQNPRSPLSFTYVTKTVATKYEPILHPYYDEALWIPDIMGKLGYPGNRFTATKNYVNDLRSQYNTDWGYVIFVVDSKVDADGKFADGLFAYSYLGGPFTVMTYDNDGYGISNMNVVSAHEMGHIFHALDEYAGASSPNDYSSGYFPTINGNHVFSPIANEPDSIMRGGLRWKIDDWARKAIGWRDSDNNGRDDILDQPPVINLNAGSTAGSAGSTVFTGNASLTILPRQANTSGYGFTLDTISKVEYRLKSGDWGNASPVDGHFDSAAESFQVTIPAPSQSALAITAKDLDLRVVTTYSLKGVTGSVGPVAPPSSTLDNAHAYPNPFKPNSGLGHTNITFANLTEGAEVHIFTVAGEPVFDKQAATGSSLLQWEAVNDDGKAVASGVYFYLITDSAGHKKKGKLAVVR